MYLDNDPGVLVSACLFGDGAGAAVLSQTEQPRRRRIAWKDSESLIDPTTRNALMFEQRQGMLRNILTRPVPTLAAEYAHRVLDAVLRRGNLSNSQISTWIMHAGGRDVLLALERRLGVEASDFRYSAAILREYGNLSSAFVYFCLLYTSVCRSCSPGPPRTGIPALCRSSRDSNCRSCEDATSGASWWPRTMR